MVRRLNDIDLCQKAWEVLREHLGPVESLRFLSLARTQPRDYQTWRDQHFRDESLTSLLDQIQETQGN